MGTDIHDSIFSVALSPDGTLVAYQFSRQDAIGENDKLFTTYPVQVFDLANRKVLVTIPDIRTVGLSFSPNGKFLASVRTAADLETVTLSTYRTTDWELFG